MDLIPLSNQGRTTGFTHRLRVTHKDLTETAANTAQALVFYQGKKGTVVQRAAFVLREPFEDTEDAAFDSTQLQVGDGDSATQLFSSQQLNENGTTVHAGSSNSGVAYREGGSDSALQVNFLSMSAKSLADLNRGEVDIFLSIVELADLGD